MRLLAFKVKNFRSIVESDWTPFSPDGITVLVGQNESGKTSVLDALHCGLSNAPPTSDDFRISAPLPSMSFKVEITFDEITAEYEDIDEIASNVIKHYLAKEKNKVSITINWEEVAENDKLVIKAFPRFDDPELEPLLTTAYENHRSAAKLLHEEDRAAAAPSDQGGPTVEGSSNPNPISQPSSSSGELEEEFSALDLAQTVWNAIPIAVPFNEKIGQLPNTVDIDANGNPTGPGAIAASNFLAIADINLKDLLRDDKRAQENKLNRANAKVSQDFNAFWSQTIGKQGKLSLKCELDNYGQVPADKAGKSHLVFWICDGNTQLYPKQRSQGVRWFISFYLQLKASEKAGLRRVFLLDEPGSNLHSKAQGDVLKLINKLAKDRSTVVYTTHSPQMIEYPKLFRVHAVQRDGELDDSPTTIIDAHRLGAASTDTLSPILLAMGSDLSNQLVIKKKNNVLLEEMSGHYYLQAFWRLTNAPKVAHFIATTGVNKLESLANMFKGWGLHFVVAVDDDNQGRGVYKNIKRDHFGDDENIANQFLIKLPVGQGIEDIFSKADFARFVLGDPDINIPVAITEYLKTAGRSKPVIAYGFALKVESGEIDMNQLSEETRANIRSCVDLLLPRLFDEVQ